MTKPIAHYYFVIQLLFAQVIVAAPLYSYATLPMHPGATVHQDYKCLPQHDDQSRSVFR